MKKSKPIGFFLYRFDNTIAMLCLGIVIGLGLVKLNQSDLFSYDTKDQECDTQGNCRGR